MGKIETVKKPNPNTLERDTSLSNMNLRQIITLREGEWDKPWTSSEVIKKMLEKEGLPMIKELGRSPLPTEYGDWTYITFGDYTNGQHHEMLVYGDESKGSTGDGEDILTRIHSSCRTNEVYHAINCECRKELHEAMTLVQKEDRGIILYLEQEGRGMGMAGKMAQLDNMFGWTEDGQIEQKRDPETEERIDTDRAYKDAGYPSESRDFTVAGEMLHHIGVKSVRLLTNNPRKIAGVTSAGIEVTPVEIHITPENEIIASDLRSKAKNLGHYIGQEHLVVKGTIVENTIFEKKTEAIL